MGSRQMAECLRETALRVRFGLTPCRGDGCREGEDDDGGHDGLGMLGLKKHLREQRLGSQEQGRQE
jgi:hypothetical protein